jgi:hypothetical protein
MNSSETQRKARSPKRKPYRSPKLVVYGNLRRLTKAKGGQKGDGGMPKTRL